MVVVGIVYQLAVAPNRAAVRVGDVSVNATEFSTRTLRALQPAQPVGALSGTERPVGRPEHLRRQNRAVAGNAVQQFLHRRPGHGRRHRRPDRGAGSRKPAGITVTDEEVEHTAQGDCQQPGSCHRGPGYGDGGGQRRCNSHRCPLDANAHPSRLRSRQQDADDDCGITDTASTTATVAVTDTATPTATATATTTDTVASLPTPVHAADARAAAHAHDHHGDALHRGADQHHQQPDPGGWHDVGQLSRGDPCTAAAEAEQYVSSNLVTTTEEQVNARHILLRVIEPAPTPTPLPEGAEPEPTATPLPEGFPTPAPTPKPAR